MRTPASPATRPPSRETIWPSVRGPGMPSLGWRLAFERLDHPVGDVDARAGVYGILEDDVELLLLGNLPDDAVGVVDDLRQLLVAPLVAVLAQLAQLALVVAVHLAEVALLGAALVLVHRHRVLFHLGLQALELLFEPGQLLFALLELGFQLGLRPDGGRRIAQHALGVDEADAPAGLRLLGERRQREERERDGGKAWAGHRPGLRRWFRP